MKFLFWTRMMSRRSRHPNHGIEIHSQGLPCPRRWWTSTISRRGMSFTSWRRREGLCRHPLIPVLQSGQGPMTGQIAKTGMFRDERTGRSGRPHLCREEFAPDVAPLFRFGIHPPHRVRSTSSNYSSEKFREQLLQRDHGQYQRQSWQDRKDNRLRAIQRLNASNSIL